MTVIAAAVTKTGVVLAADGQWSNDWYRMHHDGPKLWVADKWICGSSGSGRVAQVLKHHVTWPKYRPDEDTDFETYLVKTLVPAIRQGVKDHGVVKNESGVETIDITTLVATADKLGVIYGNGTALIEASGRWAIGSGYAEALGRLGDTGPWTEADVIDAVRIASITARGVGGRITVVNTRDLELRTVPEPKAQSSGRKVAK